MSIIDDSLVQEALDLSGPTIETILKNPKSTWGPKYVEVFIIERDDVSAYTAVIGEKEPWDPSWGEELDYDFLFVAEQKANASLREKADTSFLIEQSPWLLEEGEFLYPGGVYYGGVAVGVSGAKGIVDEGIAKILISAIVMLAKQKTQEKIRNDDYQV